VMFDTIQAFCRPGFLTEQAITLGDVIDAAKQQLEGLPDNMIKPTLDTLEKIQKEIIATSAAAQSDAQFGADVAIEDKDEIRDREDEVAELVGKLKERLAAKPVAIKDIQKASLQLSEQVTELGVKVRDIVVPTALAVPQRKLGAGECIVHAAGLLQDGLLVPNVTKQADMFSRVYGAKAHGAWTLNNAMASL